MNSPAFSRIPFPPPHNGTDCLSTGLVKLQPTGNGEEVELETGTIELSTVSVSFSPRRRYVWWGMPCFKLGSIKVPFICLWLSRGRGVCEEELKDQCGEAEEGGFAERYQVRPRSGTRTPGSRGWEDW